MRPREEGGRLHHKGQVEVMSSLEPDGRVIPYDIRFGVLGRVRRGHRVHPQLLQGVRRAHRPQRALCLPVQALAPDRPRGRASRSHRSACGGSRPAARPVSAPTWSRRRSATSRPARCSTARAGTPCTASCPGRGFARLGGLPLGLAHDVKLVTPVAAGAPVRWSDVQIDAGAEAVRVRREMEREFATPRRAAA